MRVSPRPPRSGPRRLLIVSAYLIAAVLLPFSPAHGLYNDYRVNKPSAFRDHQQVMIWDGEVYDALEGLAGTLMFSTASCFSGGFVDDLTQLDRAVVVTSNTWHGFGMSLYDFLPGQTDTRSFSDDYLNAFAYNGVGAPPTYESAYLKARDTVHQTDGHQWSWGGVEFPQFGVSGNAADGDLVYQPGDRAILFSGMWPGNEYFLSSWDYTIAGGRTLLMRDYGWPAEAVTTLFYEGQAPPERPVAWRPSGAGTKANLLAALAEAAQTMGPGNKLLVFVIAHGRSSAVMTSRALSDQQTIEYLLIPNGRNIAVDGDLYPAASYGCTQFEITGLRDLTPSHYTVTLPDSLPNWTWSVDVGNESLFIEAEDPENQADWMTPGAEYTIRVRYHRPLTTNELGRGGWTLWLPEGGGGPLFKSDTGWPGGGPWGMGEHVPGGPALGSPDPASWGHGWQTGGDGWVWVPAPAPVSSDSDGSSCFIQSSRR